MELTPAQRKLAFVVVVLALAGLGVFLLLPGSPSAHSQSGPGRPAPTASSAPATPSPLPSVPVPSPSTVNIYQWLPFTQASLAAAARVVTQFAADYATYNYTENSASYVSRMKDLITPTLASTLARGYDTPGVAQVRSKEKQSSTGDGQITALRAFGPSSLTFVVRIVQRITGQGPNQTNGDYAVTVIQSGGSWQVSDIQLASAGNS